MGFKEKVLWVSFATTLGVWAAYFATFVTVFAAPYFDAGRLAGQFFIAVFALIVIQVVAIIALAIWTPKEAIAPADDRDRDFARRANGAAYNVLSALIGTLMLAAPLAIVTAPAWLAGRPSVMVAFLVSNALLFSLVLAGLVHSGTQLFLYRRGG